MTQYEYVRNILEKYKHSDIKSTNEIYNIQRLEKMITNWAGNNLNSIKLSGSRAKGTALKGGADLDLFISINQNTLLTLKEMYTSLYDYMITNGMKCRKQNVSIGLEIDGINIDLVPGKKRLGNTNYHSLYLNKKDSWTQTNIDEHITLVKNSGRINEIILLKVWRMLHEIEFPSIYLELITIKALKYKDKNNLAENFLYLLKYLSDNILDITIVDPSNTNNVISDDLCIYEKKIIADKAKESLCKKTWGEIIW